MKVELSITINLGNYENIKIGVTEADNFHEAEAAIQEECSKLGIKQKVIKW